MKDILSEIEISKLLLKKSPVIIYEIIDSTNLEAKKNIEKIKDGTILIANEQTAGRGRGDKKFYSPKESGIYMSLILKQNMNFDSAELITMLVAIKICNVLNDLFKINSQIKWVNDIFIGDKKVGGILTEAVTNFENNVVESIIIGIGINYSTEIFPEELKNIATSLEKKENITRNIVIANIINSVKFAMSELQQNKISKSEVLSEYKKLSNIIGREILIINSNNSEEAIAENIDENGHLVVKLKNKDEQKVLVHGDVSLKLK